MTPTELSNLVGPVVRGVNQEIADTDPGVRGVATDRAFDT